MNIKNKINYILLIFIMCFAFIGDVFADELDLVVGATADKTNVVKGDIVTITVSIQASEYINACTFEQSSASSIEILPSDGDNNDNKGVYGLNSFGAVGTSKINVIDTATSGTAPTSPKNILRLKYRVNDSGTITIKTKECITFETEKTADYDDININITAIEINDDTSVKSLTVNGGTLVNFSPNNETYSVPLDRPNFSLNIEANNPAYQDKIVVIDEEGNILDPNNMKFRATNDQGYIMIVYIMVNNKKQHDIAFIYENNELDNSLASLKINGETINLKKGQLNYKYKLPKNATEMKVVAVLADSNNFQFDDESNGTWTYNKSDEIISIVIQPKKADSGIGNLTYIVEIEREKDNTGAPSNNNNNNGNTTSNPQTGNISMFVMAIILIASLIGSVILYQRNIDNYNN